MRIWVAATVLLLSWSLAIAQEESPLLVQLVAVKDKYTLNLNGKTGKEFRAALAAKEGKLPPAPAIDLVLELTNVSKKQVQVWTSGDPVAIELKLDGPGAVNLQTGRAFTREFRTPRAVTILPGNTYKMTIKSLESGFRNGSQISYWTEPGTYKISATFKTGIGDSGPGKKLKETTIAVPAVEVTVQAK